MFPVLFTVGPFTLHTYGLLVATGFAAALFYSLRQAAREGLDSDAFSNFFLIVVISAIAGSRLLYVIYNYRYFADHPLKVAAIWEGGLVFHGGLILAVFSSWLYLRRGVLPMWETADIAAPAIALGQAIGRLGCLAAGCCFGRITDLPWGIVFTHPESLAPRDLPLHPTQLYSSLSNGIIFLVLHAYRSRSGAPGRTFWLYLFLTSAARLVEDAFRAEQSKLGLLPHISAVQALALALLPLSAFFFYRFGRRRG